MTTRRNGLVAAVIVAVLAVVVGIAYAVQSGRDTTGEKADAPGGSTPTASATTTGGPQAGRADEYGLGLGNPEAPVKVEIFEDFLCPYCGQFEEQTRESLAKAAQDGDAYVVYRPIAFLDEYSARALNAFAVVLDKAGGDAARRFHDLLFERQPEEGGVMPDDNWLVDLAVAAGADEAAVRPGIEQLEFRQWVLNGAEDASKRGIRSTPSVFVDGEQVENAATIEDLAGKVEALINAENS